MNPFLSIITRCYLRPKQLERCIQSVREQTDQDYEHLFINDEYGSGIFWANTQVFEHRERVNGDWVYVLDDDDYLIDNSFISGLKKIVNNNDVGLIVCKGYIGEPLYPPDDYWKKPPIRGTIGSPNFIVKKDLYLQFADAWVQKKAGDYFFVRKIYANTKTYWWNKTVFKAPIGSGIPEVMPPLKSKKYIFHG